MATSHLNEHTTRVQERVIIPKTKLEKGMLVECRYKPQEGESKRYIILVLNPVWKGEVHALSLDNFSFIIFDRLAREEGIRYIPKFQKIRGIDIPKLDINLSSRRFYSSKLKQRMKNVYNRAYRTFKLNQFGVLNLIDYKFSNDTEMLLEGTEVEN